MTSGVHTIPASEYHNDPSDTPSLSASIANLLITATPKHAWAAHPKLNPDRHRVEDDKYDIGTAAHAWLLQGDITIVDIVEADSWRTNAAKEARDTARANGRVPLLAKDWQRVQDIVDAALEQLAAHTARPPLFTDGLPEQTLMWEEDGVVCRARLDWLRDDRTAIDDLKTTSRSANPKTYERALYAVGGDVQAAMYRRAVQAVTGVTPTFRWVVVETEPPYGLSVITPGADVLALGDAKAEWAIAMWRRCLETNDWPCYPPHVHVAEMPAYEEMRWLERVTGEVAA